MKIIDRILWAFAGLISGFAIGMRACAAAAQVFDKFLGVYTAAVIAAVFGALACIFAPVIKKHMQKHIIENRIARIAIFAIIYILCVIKPYIWVGFQMKGYPAELPDILVTVMAAGTAFILWIAAMYFVKAVTVVFAWSKIKAKLKAITKYDIIFAAAVFIVLNILMILFCLNNKTICFWDNAGFWLTARSLAEEFKSSGILSVAKSVFGSVFTTDYNFIIAVPHMFLVLLFGEARMVYIMGIANFYMYPLLMLIYAFARSRTKRPCICAALTMLSLPMIFYITKEGYIDVGAIVFAMLALLLWIRKPEDKSVERYIIIGVSLVISMILRRWLVFFVISYLVALTVDCVVYKKSATPVVSAVMAIGISLVSLFQPYVTLKLMANYKDMYSAYSQGLNQDFTNFAYYFGLLILIAVIICAAVFIAKKSTRRSALFMTIQLVVCFVVFVNVQTHGEQHLLLYIPSVSCLLCMMFGSLWASKGIRLAPAFVLSGVFAVTSVYGVTSGTKAMDNQHPAFIPRFSCMPAVRHDSDTVIELGQWLDKNVGEKDKNAAILASSLVFNREILCNAEASLNIARTSDANRDEYLMWLPQVDSRDEESYAIFEADYVVVADPIQLHLGEENQRCVQIPAESFINGTDIANAYEKLDTEFNLAWDGSVHVSIYEKKRPVSEEEQDEFKERMKNAKKN